MRQGAVGVRMVAAALVAVTCAVPVVGAQRRNPRDTPPDEERLLNAPVPDIPITTSNGARATLLQIAHGQPLVLTLVFTRCAGVCSPFLMSFRSAGRALGSRRYSRVVLSFDPRDTADDMSMLRHHLSLVESETGDWTFGVADPADIDRLAKAIGFWWDWDERRQQFDHPAMLAAIRQGRLVRLLVGGSVTSARLDELLREVSGEFVPSYPLPGRVPFRCVQFDPATGRVTLDWGFGLLFIPVVTTSLATFAMFAIGSRSRKARSVS